MQTADAVHQAPAGRSQGFWSQTDPRFESRSCHLLQVSDLHFLTCRMGQQPCPSRHVVGLKRDNGCGKALSGNGEGVQQGGAQRLKGALKTNVGPPPPSHPEDLRLGEPQSELPANPSITAKLMTSLAFCHREQGGQISFLPWACSDGLVVTVTRSYTPDPGRTLSDQPCLPRE